MHTRLVCQLGFNSFGVDFAPGDVVPDDTVATWPDGTVATRIANGFLAPVAAPGDPLPQRRAALLAALGALRSVGNRETLATFAREQLCLEVDKRRKIDEIAAEIEAAIVTLADPAASEPEPVADPAADAGGGS